MRCFNCKRAVHIHFKARKLRKQILLLDLTNKIQQFLRTANRKGRYDNIAAFLKCLPKDSCKFCHIIRYLISVRPVAISGFNHNIVCGSYRCRIFNNRLIHITYITGKDNLLLHIRFLDPDFNTCRSKQMSYICKSYPDTITQIYDLVIAARCKMFDCPQRILHLVQRLI